MKILFDTSTLVAAMVEAHPMHARAAHWLERAKSGEFEFLITNHTLAEFYSVMTTLPVKPKISPDTVLRLLNQNIEPHAKVITLSHSDYRATLKRLTESGLIGGVIYDALIAKAAENSHADRLLTLDADDARRVWPEGESRITVP